ncbi:DUF559 domain-containing protein [Microbacterium aurum]
MHEDWRSAEGEPWGYLRETAALALKAGPDRDTGLHRTGLEDYLRVIFPEISDWVHDRPCGFVGSTGKASRARPDYLSNELKLIVEFDGLQHYTTPDRIETDLKRTEFYRGAGFKVVRIPYFIQLTNAAVRKLSVSTLISLCSMAGSRRWGPRGPTPRHFFALLAFDAWLESSSRFPSSTK